MKRTPRFRWIAVSVAAGLACGLSCINAAAGAPAHNEQRLLGGPHGSVRSSQGAPLEGIMVQLISQKSAIRTTVYTNQEGRYEFPKLEAGLYTLRIARPLEFQPYVKESVRIDKATELEDIVLTRVSDSELLPPTPEIAAQLTGAEWLMNLSGPAQVKRQLIHSCCWCHSYQQIFRNRYDERSWRAIVTRMAEGRGSPLIVVRDPKTAHETPEGREELIKWLATVRGPESKDPPFYVLPRPQGPATRAIITEYELPRLELATHDVCGDSKGNIWYTAHRSSYVGKLDPRTGVVKEYRIPPSVPNALPGTHSVWVDRNDVVWLSENWAHNLTWFDPRTENFTQITFKDTDVPINAAAFGNFGLAPDGYIWYNWKRAVVKIDPKTGKVLQRYPFTKIRNTYDNLISMDGRYWSGGEWPGNLVGLLDISTGQLWEVPTPTPASDPSKGGFDRDGNAWYGGHGGALIKLDSKTRQSSEYYPPTPFVSFYEAMPDKNGEIWAGEMQGGRFARFNPRTGRWIEYVLPEPYVHDRRTWIDNSTDPVTVWYADHEGYMVRIQPLE